jgi:uncharacterized repeat protein (TIGR01451 family)
MTATTTLTPIQVFNTARVISQSFDPNPVNDVSTAPLSIEPLNTGALKIHKVAAPAATSAGSKAGWIITVQNSGSVATNAAVTLSDLMPPGAFDVTSISVTPAGNNQGSDPTVTCSATLTTPLCTFPTGINAGNSYTVVLSGSLGDSVATGTDVINTATLSNGQSASASMTANNVADVVVLKNLTTAPEAGAPLGYQVTVTNAGPSNSENLYITDTLPAGTTLLNTPSGCSVSGQTLSCFLGNMSSGTTQTLFYQVNIPVVGGTFTNHVVATSDTPFLDSTTPEDSVTVTIPGLANTAAPAPSALPLGIALTLSGSALFAYSVRRRKRASS